MRLQKPIRLFCLAIVILACQTGIQADNEAIQYYWLTSDEILLWRSLQDTTPIRIIYEPSAQRWNLPAGVVGWRPILESVVRRYDERVPVSQIDDVKLWTFVLAKLANEKASETWARPRDPFLAIYFARVDERNAEVAIVRKEGPPRQIFKFTQDTNGVWKKDQNANLDMRLLFGVEDSPEELGRIFNFTVGTGTLNSRWNEAWDKWIKIAILREPEIEQVMFPTAGGPQWIWRQRLNAGVDLPLSTPRMASSRTGIPEPSLGQAVITSPEWDRRYLLLVPVLGTLLVLLIFSWPRNLLFSFLRSLWTKAPSTQSQEQAKERTSDQLIMDQVTLDQLHRLAVQRSTQQLSEYPSNSKLVTAALELARAEYLAVLSAVVVEQASKRDEILREYWRTLGVLPNENARIAGWIDLGRKAELAQTQIVNLSIADEVLQVTDSTNPIKSWSAADWLRLSPQIVREYDRLLLDANRKTTDAKKLLVEQETKKKSQLEEIKKTAEREWVDKVTRLEKENKDGVANAETLNSGLARANAEVENLKSRASDLEGDLKTSRDYLQEVLKKELSLQDSIRRIDAIADISFELRIWLQNYHSKLLDNTREIRSVAVLMSLINFSLVQMCFSTARQQSDLTKATAHNVLAITHLFDNESNSALSRARQFLGKLEPELEAASHDLKNSTVTGSALDQRIFRDFLSWLRDDTGQDLSPFYLDIDSSQQLVFVSAS